MIKTVPTFPAALATQIMQAPIKFIAGSQSPSGLNRLDGGTLTRRPGGQET